MDKPVGYALLEAMYIELGADDHGDPNVIKALELMKEMAETLERARYELEGHSYYTFKCFEVLKKFKEWK